MWETKGCRALVVTAALMSVWTVVLLYGTYRSDSVTMAVFHSAMALVTSTVAATAFVCAVVKTCLRPMAVAWNLGMRAAQRQAVEQRTHLRAVNDDSPAV